MLGLRVLDEDEAENEEDIEGVGANDCGDAESGLAAEGGEEAEDEEMEGEQKAVENWAVDLFVFVILKFDLYVEVVTSRRLRRSSKIT